MVNYAIKLVGAAQNCHATRVRVVMQDTLLAHALSQGGMTAQLAMANRTGICAALTVRFVEAAMLGRLAGFSQNSLVESVAESLKSQFGSSFFSLMSGGTKGNFEIAASHLMPAVFPVAASDPMTAFMVAMREAIVRASTTLARTVAIGLQGAEGGHVIGVKVVPGGTSSFFDANAGLYQFPSVDDLRAFWRAAFDAAEYGFSRFTVTTFGRMPTA